MADVSRSISLPKKLSNADDLSSKHIYDGVFSAPTATKRIASTFSIRIDDYCEIFSPSDASLGSSIPILDLPAVDRSDVIGRGRSSGVDYAGVFGGLGDDDRVGVPAEVLFRESKKKAKTDSHPSRSSMATKIPVSKSQEFYRDSGNSQASKSPTKTRMTISKSQDFCFSTRDNPTSSQVSESTTKIGTMVSKGQEVCGSSRDNPISSQALKSPTKRRMTVSKSQEFCVTSGDIPTSSQSSKSPTKTRMTHSKSQEFCGSSRDNGTSSDVSTDQQFDSMKHLNIPYQKINQSSKDATAGMTQNAHLHAGPGYSRTFEEVSSARNIGLNKAKRTTMDEADFSMDVSKGKRRGKYTRAVSDIGTNKQTSDRDAHKEFGMGECHTFDASHSTREANRKPQSVSPILTSPQLFGSNNYFRRSSSQGSKSFTNNQQSDAADGSTSPLLELDVNSTAAASAAAVKRALEEAEAKIRWAKEFLKGQECDGSTKLSFKNSLKVKSTSSNYHSNEACGLKQNGALEVEARRQNKYVDEDKLLKQKGHLNTTVTSENINFNKAGGLKLKDDLNFSITKSQFADEAGMLNEKLNGVSAQEDTTMSFKSTCAAATFEEKHASLDPVECVNDAKFVEKANSPEAIKSTKKSYKDEGGGEWEAAKHISQLISGVKNRLVGFISKQADTEKIAVQDVPSSSGSVEQSEGSTCQVLDADTHIKTAADQDHVEKDRLVSFIFKQVDTENIAIQEDAPSSSGSVEQSEGSTCKVEDADAHIKRAADQDHAEKDVQMNYDASSWVGEIVQDSIIGMKIHKPGANEVNITVALEQGKVEDITASPDVEMLISQQCDLSEPDREWEVQESVEIKGELVQEDVQDQTEEDLDDCATWEHEKDQVDTNECQEKDMAQGTAYKSGVYDSKKETIFIYNIETGKEVQDQEPVDKGVDVSFDAKDGTRRQEEGCSWRETEMPKASEKNLEDFQMVEETCTVELQERVQAAELFTWENNKTIAHEDAKSKSTIGVTEVADDTSEHDEKKLEDAQMVEEICTDELQETVQAAELFTWEDNKTIEHQDAKSKSTVGFTEVADITSEHDEKKLEDAQMVEETCTDELLETVQAADLFTREDNKTVEHQDVKSKSTVGVTEVTDDTSEHDEKKLKDAQIVEETSTDDFHERVQAVELFGREDDKTIEQRDDKSKSTVGVTEVADDTSEHDEKKSEDAQMVEEICIDELQERVQAVELFTREDNKTIEHQDVNSKSTLGVTEVAEETSEHDEFLILNRNKEACLNDRSSQYAQHFGSFSGGEERIEEPEISPFAPKMNTDQPLDFNKNEEACLHDESSQYAQHLRSSSGGEERMEVPVTSPMDTKMNAEQPLVFSNDKEACLHNGSSNYAQHLESSSGGEEWMEEPATCPVEPEMNVEQPICSQTATQLVREDMCEQKPCSFEVADDVLEHDDYFPAKSHICEQEQSSMMRNEEACECDNTDQYAQDVESTNFEKGRMEKSKTKGNLQQPSSVCTVHDLIKKEMYEQTWSFDVADETVDRGEECPPPADETLDHEHECPPPADVSKNEVDSCLIEDNEGYEHDDRNEHSQDVEFSEKMRESVSVTSSESEWNTEQHSSVQTVNKLIGEDMTETSISARDREDFVIAEKEVEDTREVLHPTNFQKTQCETDVDFEQKLANEEISAADINSENQGDETEVRTDMGEVDKASDQDTRMHDAETSYKRKRWFQNRDEAGELPRSGILLGAKITLDLDQENMQGSKVDDRVETNADEGVNESGEGTNARQTGACSSVEDGCHSNEAIHRRRRWFENRGQEVLHKPSVFDGAGMTTQMDDQIAQESEFDDSLQTCVDELVNEGKKGTDAREEDVASDQVESRVTAEAAHRRRRWFESGEKLGPLQKPSILEDKGVASNQEENTAKHDELGETSTASIMENKHQSQLDQREKQKEKEKERERKAVERVIREARQRAFADARERAAVEARQKAAATASAQDKQGKDSSEAKSGSDKASMDAKLREERAAVERATAEARERALQRAMSEKAASKSKEKDSKNQTSGPSCSSGYSSATFATEKSSGVVNESPRRRKAISERHRRTTERAAKALEEKNMRDSLAQKEQAERNRFADALDADVKRWLTGKDGNLRAMLSTLQYILSPDSGWQPIPLTDLVTSTAVRKAYKRAALCVHPDKLQQRGATIQQKYICEKVFDLLKDAWHKFNPDDW